MEIVFPATTEAVERQRSGRGGPLAPSQKLLSYGQHMQLAAAATFSIADAHTVLDSMQKVCIHRGLGLIAAHVRTNHVHVVADIFDVDPNRAIGDLKAYASRALNGAIRREHRWARHGSVKLLSTHDAVNAAVRYVTVNQREPMAVYVAARNS